MLSKEIDELSKLLSQLPGIGPRAARRLAFFLAEETNLSASLSQSINNLRSLKYCSSCYRLFNGKEEECPICRNKGRDHTRVCVVEKEVDAENIEKSHSYNGVYFILGNSVGSLKKEDLKRIRLPQLLKRAEKKEVEELILALNPTLEGKSTVIFLTRKLKRLNKKITVLGQGLPTGGEIEYADAETISSSFNSRKKLN